MWYLQTLMYQIVHYQHHKIFLIELKVGVVA